MVAWSTTVLGGRVAAAPPVTVSVPRGELSVPQTSSYVPPSSRLLQVDDEAREDVLGLVDDLVVAADDLELPGIGAGVGHHEEDLARAAPSAVAGAQPAALTETAIDAPSPLPAARRGACQASDRERWRWRRLARTERAGDGTMGLLGGGSRGDRESWHGPMRL